MSRKKGLTLVELLIATAIFSVIAASLYAGFHGGVLSYNKIDATLDLYQQARLLFSRIERDLKGAYGYKVEDSRFQGNKDSFKFMTCADAFDADGVAQPQLSRVEYRFEQGVLRRSYAQGLAAFIQSQQPIVAEMADTVESCVLLYAVSSTKTEGALEWQEAWPLDEAQARFFPLAVKIQLALRPHSGSHKKSVVSFNKVIPLSPNPGMYRE